ncbi:uncharacterized protein LOC119276041 isoform X2 [Triticum dicoccoides]|uniref:uncharacterized protein LOC119276041 isoform X2 n=1 Tax=Triticum dicoccoides TaxID=85692 RepID=UPI000E7AAB14|nr:uncharacterized protein LOC119276041 isoform X2 [Triticum dicoccoides]
MQVHRSLRAATVRAGETHPPTSRPHLWPLLKSSLTSLFSSVCSMDEEAWSCQLGMRGELLLRFRRPVKCLVRRVVAASWEWERALRDFAITRSHFYTICQLFKYWVWRWGGSPAPSLVLWEKLKSFLGIDKQRSFKFLSMEKHQSFEGRRSRDIPGKKRVIARSTSRQGPAIFAMSDKWYDWIR